MRTYIFKRLLLAVPTLIGVSILVFSLLHVLPGDIVQQLAGDNEVTPEFRAQKEAELGIDGPRFPVSVSGDAPFVQFHSENQFTHWLKGVRHRRLRQLAARRQLDPRPHEGHAADDDGDGDPRAR